MVIHDSCPERHQKLVPIDNDQITLPVEPLGYCFIHESTGHTNKWSSAKAEGRPSQTSYITPRVPLHHNVINCSDIRKLINVYNIGWPIFIMKQNVLVSIKDLHLFESTWLDNSYTSAKFLICNTYVFYLSLSVHVCKCVCVSVINSPTCFVFSLLVGHKNV